MSHLQVDIKGWADAYGEYPDVILGNLQTRMMLEQRGISYSDLAKELGCTKQSIGRHLSHKMVPDGDKTTSKSVPRIKAKLDGRDRIDMAIDRICAKRGYTYPEEDRA